MKSKILISIFAVLMLLLTIASATATTYTHLVLNYPLNNFNSSGLIDWNTFGSSPISVAYGANYIAINASSTELYYGSGWVHKFNWTTRYPLKISWKQQAYFWQQGNTILNFKMSDTIPTIYEAGTNGYCMAEIETDVQNQPPLYYWFNYKYDNPNYATGTYQATTSFPSGWVNFTIILTPSGDNITQPNIVWYRDGALMANASVTSGVCLNVDNMIVYFGMANSQPQTTFIKDIQIDGYAVDVAPSSNGDCTGVVCANTCIDSNYVGVNGTCLVNLDGHICAYDSRLCSDGCLNGACQNTGCSDQPNPSYTFPTLWYEPFNYNGETITAHGWKGYPFVIGQNWLNTCNELYAPTLTSTAPLFHNFSSAYHQPITFTWDMWLSSDNGNGTYMGEAQDTFVHLLDSNGNDAILLQFSLSGEINLANSTSYPNTPIVIGNWQGAGYSSYRMDIRPDEGTFDFYYTNSSPLFSVYHTGCINCSFTFPLDNIKGVEFEPEPFIIYMPNNTTTNWGVWLDELKVTDTAGQANYTQDNFCNFADCIYYDPFSYTDSTYNHGWFLYQTTPTGGYIILQNNTLGYYFQHDFDTFRQSDGAGVVTFQFKALFPQPVVQSGVDIVNAGLDGAFNLEFSHNSIIDLNTHSSLGTYAYNTWNTYTIVLDLTTSTYDLYIDQNKIASSQPITPLLQVSRLTFWQNDPASVHIDNVIVARGTSLLAGLSGNPISDTGVSASDLRVCWSPHNGTFDWTCCNAQERIDKSMLCPARVTGLYILGNIANFILGNFVYFIIIVILLVIFIPFFVPRPRRN